VVIDCEPRADQRQFSRVACRDITLPVSPQVEDGVEGIGAQSPWPLLEPLEQSFQRPQVRTCLLIVVVEGLPQDRRLRPSGQNRPLHQFLTGRLKEVIQVSDIDLSQRHELGYPPRVAVNSAANVRA
jgi:hypothetical protein